MWIDRVLVVALAGLAGQTAPLGLGPLVVGFAGVALVLFQAVPSRVWLLVAVALGASSWRATVALERFERARVASRDSLGEPSRCAASGRVVASPTKSGDSFAVVAELDGLDCEGRWIGPLRARIHTSVSGLGRGDRFEAVVQVASVRLFRNPGARDPLPQAARRGIVVTGSALALDVVEAGRGLAHGIDGVRARARARIESTFSPRARGMARALVLGENDLDPDDDDAFRRSGLSHMLAVSGTHLVFAVVALVRALTALLVRVEALAARFDVARLAALFGIPLSLVYADFAGGTGSAWRAAFMLVAVFAARAVARAPSASRALAASLIAGVVLDPLVAFDLSFLLSAAATSGLLSIGRSLAAPCARLPRLPRFVGESVAATFSSMLPCAPLLCLLAPELTLAGVIANVLASPFGELVALPLCLSHLLLEPWPALERGVALVASGALLVVRQIAHESAGARFLAFGVPEPTGFHLGVMAVAGAALFRTRGLSVRDGRLWRLAVVVAAFLALSVLERAARAEGAPVGRLRVTAIDVGQGDSTLLDLPDGSAMLIDAGGFVGSPVDPGRAAVLPLLRARRRERLDVVVLSHPHPDHFGGLASVIRALDVGELWDSGQGESEGAGPVYAELLRLARARGIKVLRPNELCGRARRYTAAVVEVLAPCPSAVPGRDANDNSLVLRVTFGERAVLLTGDAEAVEERELIRSYGRTLRADLLKVGHHGSRTSTSDALLDVVKPSAATISCGVRNRFGHPHRPVLERLARRGVAAYRLDRSGGVAWMTDGKEVSIQTAMMPR